MADQGFSSPQLEQRAIKNKSIQFVVRIVGNATVASVTAVTDCIGAGSPTFGGARVILSSGSLTAPPNAFFSGLTSGASPTVVGIYVGDGRAIRLNRAEIIASSIQSASMTAGVVTKRGAASAISGSTGITSNGDIAFTASLTALQDTVALTHEFTVQVDYDAF